MSTFGDCSRVVWRIMIEWSAYTGKLARGEDAGAWKNLQDRFANQLLSERERYNKLKASWDEMHAALEFISECKPAGEHNDGLGHIAMIDMVILPKAKDAIESAREVIE